MLTGKLAKPLRRSLDPSCIFARRQEPLPTLSATPDEEKPLPGVPVLAPRTAQPRTRHLNVRVSATTPEPALPATNAIKSSAVDLPGRPSLAPKQLAAGLAPLGDAKRVRPETKKGKREGISN